MKDLILISCSKHELKAFITDSIQKALESKVQASDNKRKRYAKVKELSEYTGIPVSTIRTKASKFEIPYTKPGKELIFDLDEIDEWLRTKKVKTNEELEKEIEEEENNSI